MHRLKQTLWLLLLLPAALCGQEDRLEKSVEIDFGERGFPGQREPKPDLVLAEGCVEPINPTARNKRVAYTAGAGVSLITLWGVAKWDYFTRSPHTDSEGWFGNDTSEGGADKVGHLYSTYLASHALSYLYESWCFERDDAALYGALTSWLIMGYMEFGDSFSDYGFSNEDMVANTVGALAGYFLYRHPDLASKIDIRWEYGFDPQSSDFITDYENSKYLLALKLNGFEALRKTPLRYLELHVGYYTRGFDDDDPDRERNVFVGIGLNLTDLLFRNDFKRTATFFRYYQLPYTSVQYAEDLND